MKYLKYLIEQQETLKFLDSNKYVIEESLNDYLDNFIPYLSKYIHENIHLFLDGQNTFFNIKKYTVDQSLQYFQEGPVGFAIAAGVGIAGWEIIKHQLSNLWGYIFPSKNITITVDSDVKEQLLHLTNVLPISQEEIEKANSASIVSSPLLLLLVFGLAIYSGNELIKQFTTISKIANLKNDIEKIFDRLMSLGVHEANRYKEFNASKYEEHISRCPTPELAFEVFTVNVSCRLDAYLTYCASMIISLANIYVAKVKAGSQIDNMRSLLAVKDEFLINQMLTSSYNNFCSAIEFIYAHEPATITKWKKFLDASVAKITSAVKRIENNNDTRQYIPNNNKYQANKPK